MRVGIALKERASGANAAQKGHTQPWLYAGMDVGAGFTPLSGRC